MYPLHHFSICAGHRIEQRTGYLAYATAQLHDGYPVLNCRRFLPNIRISTRPNRIVAGKGFPGLHDLSVDSFCCQYNIMRACRVLFYLCCIFGHQLCVLAYILFHRYIAGYRRTYRLHTRQRPCLDGRYNVFNKGLLFGLKTHMPFGKGKAFG